MTERTFAIPVRLLPALIPHLMMGRDMLGNPPPGFPSTKILEKAQKETAELLEIATAAAKTMTAADLLPAATDIAELSASEMAKMTGMPEAQCNTILASIHKFTGKQAPPPTKAPVLRLVPKNTGDDDATS